MTKLPNHPQHWRTQSKSLFKSFSFSFSPLLFAMLPEHKPEPSAPHQLILKNIIFTRQRKKIRKKGDENINGPRGESLLNGNEGIKTANVSAEKCARVKKKERTWDDFFPPRCLMRLTWRRMKWNKKKFFGRFFFCARGVIELCLKRLFITRLQMDTREMETSFCERVEDYPLFRALLSAHMFQIIIKKSSREFVHLDGSSRNRKVFRLSASIFFSPLPVLTLIARNKNTQNAKMRRWSRARQLKP